MKPALVQLIRLDIYVSIPAVGIVQVSLYCRCACSVRNLLAILRVLLYAQ